MRTAMTCEICNGTEKGPQGEPCLECQVHPEIARLPGIAEMLKKSLEDSRQSAAKTRRYLAYEESVVEYYETWLLTGDPPPQFPTYRS
jgi:hypothetical protein